MSKERSCTRKVRYGHADTAYRAIQDMRTKHGAILESYQCEYCAGWHIGHKKDATVEIRLKPGFTRTQLLAALEDAGVTDEDDQDEVLAAVRAHVKVK